MQGQPEKGCEQRGGNGNNVNGVEVNEEDDGNNEEVCGKGLECLEEIGTRQIEAAVLRLLM